MIKAKKGRKWIWILFFGLFIAHYAASMMMFGQAIADLHLLLTLIICIAVHLLPQDNGEKHPELKSILKTVILSCFSLQGLYLIAVAIRLGFPKGTSFIALGTIALIMTKAALTPPQGEAEKDRLPIRVEPVFCFFDG